MKNKNLPTAIIGGGPIGLAAAAHLAQNNIPFILFESGQSVGENILSWQHVQLFSPWKYNIDKAAKELLLATNWVAPNPAALPTGKELVKDYLRPLAAHPAIAESIHLASKVISIGRKGLDKMKTAGRNQRPYFIKVEEKGQMKYYEAKAVIDATGTWNQPNPIGSGGVTAEGESELSQHIFYGIPDVKGQYLERYKNKNILVVGSGHSAINALLDLAEVQKTYPNTRLHWVLRKEQIETVYGGKQNDALEARGALGMRIEALVNSGKVSVYTPFHILKLSKKEAGIEVEGTIHDLPKTIGQIDEIISNTGARPNLDMLREIRVDVDASLEAVFDLAELIDPNLHSCGTVRPHGEKELQHPEKDFYIVGSKSYGRAPTFLMATGYEQVRSVVASLAGDQAAAERVELELPATGVCSSDRSVKTSSCCTTTSCCS